MKIYLDDTRKTPVGWVHCRWPNEVIDLLKTENVEEISLDYNLGYYTDWDTGRKTWPTGSDVLIWLEEHKEIKVPKIYIHTSDPIGEMEMEEIIEKLKNRMVKQNRNQKTDCFVHLNLDKVSAGDVIYFVFPNSGQDWEQEEAESLLELGKGYTIDSIYVGGWSSKVILEEIPNIKFNTVFFGIPG